YSRRNSSRCEAPSRAPAGIGVGWDRGVATPERAEPMEREAFSRARSFLNYAAPAKWSALVAAVSTALLYVVLLIVLGLFADLIVHRGQMPQHGELLAPERSDFQAAWNQLSAEQRQEALRSLQRSELSSKDFERLAVDEPSTLSRQDHELQWQAYVFQLLQN